MTFLSPPRVVLVFIKRLFGFFVRSFVKWSNGNLANSLSSNGLTEMIKFGYDAENDVYGYIKAGADTVSPFKTELDDFIIDCFGAFANNNKYSYQTYMVYEFNKISCAITSNTSYEQQIINFDTDEVLLSESSGEHTISIPNGCTRIKIKMGGYGTHTLTGRMYNG